MSVTRPEVEITFERKRMTKRFQRLPPHLLPCPTQICHCRHCPTSADIRNSERGWSSAMKPEIEIALNGKRMRRDFNGYPHISDHAQLRYGTADTTRHRKLKCRLWNRSGNWKWKYILNGNIWRSDSHCYPHIFDHALPEYNTADIVRHRSTSGTNNRNL